MLTVAVPSRRRVTFYFILLLRPCLLSNLHGKHYISLKQSLFVWKNTQDKLEIGWAQCDNLIWPVICIRYFISTYFWQNSELSLSGVLFVNCNANKDGKLFNWKVHSCVFILDEAYHIFRTNIYTFSIHSSDYFQLILFTVKHVYYFVCSNLLPLRKYQTKSNKHL